MADFLPEHVIVKILEKLPTKSLIRFLSVSKRWRSIILSDSHFAKSQFQLASQSRRILFPTTSVSEFQSLDLDALPPPSPLTVVWCPFTQPVRLLCSCNGLVFAVLNNQENTMFIWNPATQFFKQLPNPLELSSETQIVWEYGFGYLSATDDYKAVIRFDNEDDHDYYDSDEVEKPKMHVFSSKANIWETTEAPLSLESICNKGILLNEELHWLGALDICSFDLAEEVFRKMPLPITDGVFEDLISFGDCLCAFDFENAYTAGTIDLWVLKTYGVAASWTKLFNLNISDQPQKLRDIRPLLVLETSTLLLRKTLGRDGRCVRELIRSDHTKVELETHVLCRITDFRRMVEYEESLLWLVHSSRVVEDDMEARVSWVLADLLSFTVVRLSC